MDMQVSCCLHELTECSHELMKCSHDHILPLQGSSTAILELNNLQIGDYVFTLTVADAIGQHSSAEVSVAVVEGNLPSGGLCICIPYVHLIAINRGQ